MGTYIIVAKKGNQKLGRVLSFKRITSATKSRKDLISAGYRVSRVQTIRMPKKQRKRRGR